MMATSRWLLSAVNFGKVLQIFAIAGATAEVYFRLYQQQILTTIGSRD
jgi:hypothetical protein